MARVKLTQINLRVENCMGKRLADLYNTIERENPSVLAICEAWEINLKKVLPAGWDTNQVWSGYRKPEAAVAWRVDQLRPSGGRALIHGATTEGGGQTRYFSRQDLTWRDTGTEVRFMSCHVPRQTISRTRPAHKRMMSQLVSLCNNSTVKKIALGGDYNIDMERGDTDRDPWGIKRRANLVDRSRWGDGWLLRPSLNPSGVDIGADIYGDHRPISVTIDM